FVDPLGVELGSRWTAIEAVGIYVPGGTAAYPSSVLMNAVPAKVAGVPRLVMTVPAPRGKLNPLVLAAAKLARSEEPTSELQSHFSLHDALPISLSIHSALSSVRAGRRSRRSGSTCRAAPLPILRRFS